VSIAVPGGQLTSAQESFTLDIQPPNPILISPPSQITRQAPEEDAFNAEALAPASQSLRILIEFPDGHPRPLVRTTLYVDGQIADENTSEPFDTFTWDLQGYSLSGEHHIMVEAVDSLALSRSSMAFPVTLTVIQPPRGVRALFARYRLPITATSVSVAGLALLFVLLRGRLHIPGLRARRKEREVFRDPLTQPVPVAAEPATSPLERARRKREREAAAVKVRTSDASASLVHLLGDGQPATDKPISVADRELVLGTDPVQCNQVLDDPSIGPVHARLRRTPDGGFLLSDNGSVAGTWVNYDLVPREGRLLQSGDVIHFGQLIYRFQLRTPPPLPQPKVTLENPAG
jgi:hypothetical protein